MNGQLGHNSKKAIFVSYSKQYSQKYLQIYVLDRIFERTSFVIILVESRRLNKSPLDRVMFGLSYRPGVLKLFVIKGDF